MSSGTYKVVYTPLNNRRGANFIDDHDEMVSINFEHEKRGEASGLPVGVSGRIKCEFQLVGWVTCYNN